MNIRQLIATMGLIFSPIHPVSRTKQSGKKDRKNNDIRTGKPEFPDDDENVNRDREFFNYVFKRYNLTIEEGHIIFQMLQDGASYERIMQHAQSLQTKREDEQRRALQELYSQRFVGGHSTTREEGGGREL